MRKLKTNPGKNNSPVLPMYTKMKLRLYLRWRRAALEITAKSQAFVETSEKASKKLNEGSTNRQRGREKACLLVEHIHAAAVYEMN